MINLSTLAAPSAIEALSFETLFAGFQERFQTYWDALRVEDPSLPAYDVGSLETDPVMVVGQAWSYLRLLDRARVNDGVKALLAPTASGADLDNVVWAQGITRLVLIPATDTEPAVYETDAQLLRRYLLSFQRFAAGSATGMLYRAYTATPALTDAKVNGHAVHGRIGDADLVVLGPNYADLTDAQFSAIRSAVFGPGAYPEALGGFLRRAVRVEYDVHLRVRAAAAEGPAREVARKAAEDRVRAAALVRQVIGVQVARSFLVGAAYGDGRSILGVDDLAPIALVAEPYTAPILRNLVVELA
ncbi:hypothetical protein [Palleronia sp.]|uniref:hypothetical protein n=1 Tax=Palleronia sp. TaxID=1940284 RepID=UPI0035C86962